MKVSSSMIYDQLSLTLRENSDKLALVQTRLATGKRLSRPSDDPEGASIAMDYRVSIRKSGMYAANIVKAQTQLKFTSTVLGGVADELSNLIKIVRDAGGASEDRRKGLAAVVESARDQLLGHANSRFSDKYIFSGYLTDRPAFDGEDYHYAGDAGEVRVPVGESAEVAVNFRGTDVFSYVQTQDSAALDDGTVVTYSQDPATREVTVSFSDDPLNTFSFSNAIDMTNVLRWSLEQKAGDGATPISSANAAHRIQSLLIPFNEAFAQVASRQSDVGARLAVMESEDASLRKQIYSNQKMLSLHEDADPAETALEVKELMTALDALRASSARILSQSIFTLIR